MSLAKKKTTKKKPASKKKAREYKAMKCLMVQTEVGAGEFIAKIHILEQGEKVTLKMIKQQIIDLEKWENE